MKSLPRTVWVIVLLLAAALLLASGVIGGTAARQDKPWSPIESRAGDGAAPHQAAQDCPAKPRAPARDA